MDVHGRDLRYFVTVAEELHFTRAAERLYISQPALSKQIRILERTLGTPLFNRNSRDVQLTSVGQALLPHAQRLLADWSLAEEAVEQFKDARSHTLVVGMSTSPGRGGLLPAIRSRFTDQYPDVTLTLRQVGWDDPTAGLADASSDVAFVWLPLPDPGHYRWIVLLQEPCLVAMPEQHPLAARESIHFDQLLDEPFLALPTSAGPLRDYWLAVTARHGRAPIVGAEITNSDETYEALVGGLGVCLLASGNAPSVTRGGIVTRPVLGLPPCQLALAWPRAQQHPLVRPYAQCAQQTNTRPARTASTQSSGTISPSATVGGPQPD